MSKSSEVGAMIKSPHHPPMIRPEVRFFEHQIEGIRWMKQWESLILGDDQGLGKEQPVSEPVLTPQGWAKMGSLTVGDYVIGQNGRPTKVMGVYPQGLKETYRVTFSDGSWTRCGIEHLWKVSRSPNTDRELTMVLSTRQLLEGGQMETSYHKGRTYYTEVGISRPSIQAWQVPMAEPVEFAPGRELCMDPYTLGAWLGDGSSHPNGRERAKYTSKTDVDWFEGKLDGFKRGPGQEHVLLGMTGPLNNLGLLGRRSWEKFIPESYLRASIEDRRAILAGLMDTDGTATTPHATEYSTCSEALKDGVVDLVQSLGGVARVSVRIPTYTYKGERRKGRLSYRINVKLPEGENPFRLPRKADAYDMPTKYRPARIIRSIEPDGKEESVCIRVEAEDHLYLTRGYIVTHNTLMTITTAALDFSNGTAKRMLVICPGSITVNWLREFEVFSLFTTDYLRGPPAQQQRILKKFKDDDTQVMIMSYGMMMKHLGWINRTGFDIVVGDECQLIKNPRIDRTKMFHSIIAKRFFLLSGTVLENTPDEAWSPLRVVAGAEAVGSYDSWLNRYCIFGGQGRKVTAVKNASALQKVFGQIMLRRTKDQCLDLPNKQHIKIEVELSPEQQRLYYQLENDLLQIGEPPKNPVAAEMVAALSRALRLRQLCVSPKLLGPDFDGRSGKLDELVRRAKLFTDQGERVVVFTGHSMVPEILIEMFDKEGIQAWGISGKTNPNSRMTHIDAWEQSAQAGVLIGTYKTMGAGYNLTRSSTMFLADKPYVPGHLAQAEDRIYRIGQNSTAQIYSIIATGTYEERIEKILASKGNVIDGIIPDSGLQEKLYAAIYRGSEFKQ